MPALDAFKKHARTLPGGPMHLQNVTPDDAQDLSHVAHWVYISVAGTLRITTNGGETLTTPEMAAGWHLMEVARVFATGTTATGIMVGW